MIDLHSHILPGLDDGARSFDDSLEIAQAAVAEGVTAIIAHPERNPEVQDRPDRLADVVRDGALVQITSASLDGRLGRASKTTSHRLLELGLVHLLASDAHGPHVRDVGLAEAVSEVG